MEQTLKNAIAFAKREMNKYANDSGTYGRINGLLAIIENMYYLRKEEVEIAKEKLNEYANKNYLYNWID